MVKPISRILILFIIFLSGIFLTCSKDSTGPKEEGTLIKAIEGGVLISEDDLLTLTIPPNALDKDTYIDIEIISEADYPADFDSMGIVGAVYDLRPDGLELNIPASIEIEMPEDDVMDIVENGEYPVLTGFGRSADGSFSVIDSSRVLYNLSDNTAEYSGQIDHFSVHAAIQNIFWTRQDEFGDQVEPLLIGPVKVIVSFGLNESPIDYENQIVVECKNLTEWNLDFSFTNHYQYITPVQWNSIDANVIVQIGRGSSKTITEPIKWVCKEVGEDDLYIFTDIGVDDGGGYGGVTIAEIDFQTVVTCISQDSDGDGWMDHNDNCPDVSNPGQFDNDLDGWGNECDNCPEIAQTDQKNSDGDLWGDACDNCPVDDNVLQQDNDNDGWGNACDNCPEVFQTDQLDSDNDGWGDACDNCPDTWQISQIDSDFDGWGDACDNCPYLWQNDQDDSDLDGWGNACDICEGFDDNIDSDFDEVPDGCDICEGFDDNIDSDFDEVPNGCDICEGFDDRIDSDGDLIPDGCDTPTAPPIIINVCDGVVHGTNSSVIHICVEYSQLPVDGHTTLFTLTEYGSIISSTIEVPHNVTLVDCANFTIASSTVPYNWKAVVQSAAGNATVEGGIFPGASDQDCNYTGPTDTDG